MNQLDTFASLRPDVETLNSQDKATLRREIFGATTETELNPPAHIATGRPAPHRRPRWLPAVAAGVLLVVGAAGIWAMTGNGSGDAPDSATASPPTDGAPISSPTVSDQPAWYQTVHSLVPAGFDHIAIVPDNPSLTNEGVSLFAVDASSGLVLDINISTVAEIDMPDIDAWEYNDFVGVTNVLTLDGNLIKVRCGVTFDDEVSPPAPISGVDMANDVCGATGRLTASDRRAVADAFATAADRGELAGLDAAAERSTEGGVGIDVLPVVEALFGDLGEKPLAFYEETGTRQEIELPSQPGGDYTTTLGVVRGFNPAFDGATDAQVNRTTLDGYEGPEEAFEEDGATRGGEIATVTLVKGDIVYLAVTSDVSDAHLEALSTLITDVAEQVATAPPVAPAPQPEAPEVSMPPASLQNRLAVGDLVVAGAGETLTEHGWYVAAQPDYSAGDVVSRLGELAGQGFENDLVLVNVGTNGPLTTEQIDAVLAPLADAELVLLYNIHADRPWRDDNNELLAQAAAARPNVQLIDWNSLATSCSGDCFYEDGIYLKPDGIAYFEQLATDAWANR